MDCTVIYTITFQNSKIKLFFFTFICVCGGGVGGDGNACQNMRVETRRKCVGIGCLLPQCGSWDWNLSPQAWQQEPLSSELPH